MQKDGESNKMAWRIVYGNDPTVLADALGDELFSSSSRPFENRIVAVPNPAVKDFLFQCFTMNPRLKIAAGVQVLPLNQAVMEILDNVSRSANRKRIPSFLELSLAIEEQLYHLISCKQEFHSLLEYVNFKDEDKKSKRVSGLSDELARCFSRYGLYGKQFLPDWLKKEGWQQTIWKSLFSKDSPWTYPLESLKDLNAGCFQGKIVLFGFSYLSPAHLGFFCAVPATIYQLSPCAQFWGDFASDKERLASHRFFRRKGGKENVLEELDRYMQQSHPLLANWGKLGREMLKSLDVFLLEETEAYQENDKDHLLSRLKSSLLTLDESEELREDASIQLHSATSKLREVEVLRDSLETLLQEHHNRLSSIQPREILIASPDISGYAPYIHMVFSQSAFSYQIEGMPLISVSEAVKGFMQLIQLVDEDYSLNAILKLLRCPPCTEKRGFAFDEVSQLSKWFKQAQIRRGLKGNPNSWEEGIDRLLFGLAMIPGAGIFETYPVDAIPQSEIDLFNRFLEFFFELKEDLAVLKDKKSASEWLELFLRIADKYFLIQWEKEPFFQELKSLALSCRSLKEQEWNFESISRVLAHLSQKTAGKMTSPKLEKIAFVPLRSGNIGAARIIWCLGMDEGSFPRADVRSSLCEMNRLKSPDYYPLKADEERSLFLEMLTQAKDYLIFSYQRIHAEDGKHQGPSLLIEELDQYLQKRGMAGGMMKTDHPALPFDRVYFEPDAKVKKWAEADFLAAKAYYFPHRTPSPLFPLKPFSPPPEEEIFIDIRQLKKLARSPLQFYFNETLKMYLNEEEDEEESEFLISRLHRSMLRKKALHAPLAEVLHQTRSQGTLPRGLFQAPPLARSKKKWKTFSNI